MSSSETRKESTPDQTGELLEEEITAGSLSDAADMHYLTEDNVVFHKTEGQMLAVTVGDETHSAVYVHCSFPHTNKHMFLSVRTLENREIGMIRRLSDFSDNTQQLLEEQLQIRYFTPEIRKVITVNEEFGYSYWETETSAGLCRFTVRGGGGNVKLVSPDRLLVTDVDGNRFVIPNISKLQDKEFRMVELCMYG
ncbi:DUF1854 domain-containing protein [Paenibacillus taichungensis]|uniref:DUF1854 domain-containing protein n=1 Tax=Paenibacillus taichungensis TaxID=484184 RepID=A0ABX2MSA7_9BACL|nr:DUF1854 domain-containing protein [Paenibacillus taichungensis]NUU56963.1 DUF1854 domain-containing protein [Paenibacillus taichungensis]